MTKRFVQNTNLVMQNNEVYVVCGNEHSADVVTTALNELIEENRQLKKQLDYHTRMHEWFRNEAYLLQNKLGNREDEIRRLKGDVE